MANECNAQAAEQFDDVLRKELEWLGRQDDAEDEPLSALCLSGGGIRSATYCLGVLQGLAEKRILGKFHYLSTVSGGGYIGSWLTAWIKREGFPKVMQELARPGNGSDVEAKPVRRLREYTNYLSPVWGLSTDFLSLVATSLRNLTLTWLVLVPLMAAALMLPRLALAGLSFPVTDATVLYGLTGLAVALLLTALAYVAADLPHGPVAKPPRDRFVPLCFVPVLASAGLFALLAAWDPGRLRAPGLAAYAVCGAVLHLLAASIATFWRPRRGLQVRPTSAGDVPVIVISGAVGGALLHYAVGWAEHLRGSDARILYTTLAVPALLCVFWAAGVVYAGATSRFKSEDDREWWARANAWWLGAGTTWVIACVLVFYLPGWILGLSWLQTALGPQSAGIGTALLGVATAAFGFWSKNGTKMQEQAKTALDAIGLGLLQAAASVFIVALLVVLSISVSCALRFTGHLDSAVKAQQQSMEALKSAGWDPKPPEEGTAAARRWKQPTPKDAPVAARMNVAYATVLADARADYIFIGILGLGGFGLFVLWVTGVNAFSLHSMYGNRLARAYLGASNPQPRRHWFTGFDPADNPRMARDARLPEDEAGGGRRLFHIVNAALNITDPAGGRLEWQQRMAESFTFSRLHCGCRTLGYAPTAQYGSGDGGLSMGRAMAISGAAASPSMGYHTSRPVAFAMTFLNVRLGWWMPNPSADKSGMWPRREPPVGIDALMAEAQASSSGTSDFVYLSDGGHFENLGLYEMVRRRCRRIVVVDASCDAGYQFDDLQDAIRKIRVDMGVAIDFPADSLPTPETVKKTRRHLAVGTIDYSAVDPAMKAGSIVYIKPVLVGDEPLDVASYAAQNKEKGRAFPHQPTSDQFFDESQFESYRMLGRHAVRNAFADGWEYAQARDDKPGPSARNALVHALVPANTTAGVPATIPAMEPALTAAQQARDIAATMPRPVIDTLGNMTQGAMLAAAITVGGVVGVTGTVALKPDTQVSLKDTQLRLDDESRRLLASLNSPGGGTPAPGGPPGMPGMPTPNADLAPVLSNLQDRLKDVQEALRTSAAATAKLGDSATEHAKATSELAKAIPPLASGRATAAMIDQVNKGIEEVRAEMRTTSAQDRQRLSTALEKLTDAVGQVDKTVKAIGPRGTVRGVSDGGQR